MIDLLQFLDVDVGDNRADTVDGLNQALGLEARQDTPDRGAANLEFLGEFFLGQPASRRVVEQADAVAQDQVDAFEPFSRRKRTRGRSGHGRGRGVRIKRHPASRTACRNCRVRSFLGAPKSSLGGPCSQILPW